jgi:hypothetical protein
LPYGIDTSNIDLGAVPSWVWLILLIVGLLLCFFGEFIWELMVSLLGAMIGFMIGSIVGYSLTNQMLCALGMGFLGAMLGSMIFQLLAKAAVALLCGLLAFAGVAYLIYNSNPDDTSTPVIAGLIAAAVVFVIASIYVEEIVGVFLAAVGGFLVGVAVYFLVESDAAIIYAVLAGGVLFLLGAVFQITTQRERKRPRRAPPRRRPARRRKPPTKKAKEKPPSKTFKEKPPSKKIKEKPPQQGQPPT